MNSILIECLNKNEIKRIFTPSCIENSNNMVFFYFLFWRINKILEGVTIGSFFRRTYIGNMLRPLIYLSIQTRPKWPKKKIIFFLFFCLYS